MTKNDGNESSIRRALIDAGCTVERIQRRPGSGLQGVPDLLVGFNGRNYLLEVKLPGEKLTNDQPEWHARWRGQVAIVRSAADARFVVGILPFTAEAPRV